MTEKSILIPSALGWAPVSLAAEPSRVPISGQIGLVDPWRLFGGKGVTQWNPSNLVGIKGLRIYDEMRRDEQIKAAIAFKKHAILAAGWDIVSPEGRPDEWGPRDFVDWSFDRLAGSISDRIMMMLTCVEYGFSIAELVWGERGPDGQIKGALSGGPFAGKWPLDDIVAIKPHSVQLEQDEHGKLLRIMQRGIGEDIEIPAAKAVLMTYQNEWSNLYGRSDFDACYDDWWGKTNARKWLAMLLERFGIPPIFAMYNHNSSAYKGENLETLKNVITKVQAATASVIPRLDKDDIEFWAPTLASNVQDVFIPALDRYDKGMARGILMPNLMGATPDEKTGSFARAAIVFDVFMFAVDALRTQVEECINDQIIWRIIAVNYPIEGDEYPRFKFKPLTQDSRIDLMETWCKLVTAGVVLPRIEDEVHSREILGYPSVDSEPIAPPEPVAEPGEEDDDKKETEMSMMERAGRYFQGQSQIDFKAIEKRLDTNERTFISEAKDDLEQVLAILQRSIKAGQQSTSVDSIRGMSPFQASLRLMMMGAFEDGRQDLKSEVGAVKKLQAFPRVKPRDAVAFLKRKAITLTATIEDEILRDVRRILIAGVETGMSTVEMVEALGVVFERWTGSDVLRDGEAVKPYRLEAIARTETTNAYNHGRVVAARDPELKGLVRGMRFDAILDSRTSEVCQHLNGKIIRMGDDALDGLTPPLHVNCRSILTPITVSRQVDESEFITPSEVGRAKELAGSGFAGGGSF